MIVKKKSVACSLFLISSLLYGMQDFKDSNQEKLVVYAIPGQNGLGGDPDYIKEIFGHNTEVVQVKTPSRMQDLGQYFCVRHLYNALEHEERDVVLYGTSEGTATIVNYLTLKDKSKNIKAVILESVLASGNSAIYHTATGPLMDCKFLKAIPFHSVPGAYYFAPYLATAVCWGYRPGGQQTIKSVDRIRSDIPIIIFHSKNDLQLPFDGACALYYRFWFNGNNNVYFMSKEGYQHINLINSMQEKYDVRAIVEGHCTNVPYKDGAFAEFQPTPEQFKQQYNDLINKENNHRFIERTLVAMVLWYILSL